ncbi:MAG: hypothetical protein KDA80_14235 [Planctomycetaceae bacterium]|nr:hypothetical protein [Planctomycetaceae bacterium]
MISCQGEQLNNENVTSEAPENVVSNVRETLENMQKQLQSIEDIIQDLS